MYFRSDNTRGRDPDLTVTDRETEPGRRFVGLEISFAEMKMDFVVNADCTNSFSEWHISTSYFEANVEEAQCTRKGGSPIGDC